MLDLFLQASFIILILVTLIWGISVIIKDVSIVDLFWGMGFVIVNAFYFYNSGDLYQRKILLLVLVSLWGLRLSVYLSWRNIGKGEDFRYQNFRRKYGIKRYWWFSYFQVFLLQGALILLVSLPLLGVNIESAAEGLNWMDYLGILVFIIGFTFEAGGDYQLAKFKKNPKNKGQVLSTGFWKYTRHPNYFGDSAVWWSFGIFSIAAASYWTVIGSILMTFIIIKISGVSLIEKSLNETKPQYKEYIEKTNSFFPWFPKK
ncbi:DUF1295 domain-containing protein [Ancylomarina sp.]|uniref:DUF1295 domain-containing protein n=1 Tax=Ancylomarina sp. TaxID=1970196 RepID=UPI0035628F25